VLTSAKQEAPGHETARCRSFPFNSLRSGGKLFQQGEQAPPIAYVPRGGTVPDTYAKTPAVWVERNEVALARGFGGFEYEPTRDRCCRARVALWHRGLAANHFGRYAPPRRAGGETPRPLGVDSQLRFNDRGYLVLQELTVIFETRAQPNSRVPILA
jgi:hypothetical protein